MSEKQNMTYYERAMLLQKKKIDSQKLELARMNGVYMRNVRATKIRSAFGFLFCVIWDKITNKIKK